MSTRLRGRSRQRRRSAAADGRPRSRRESARAGERPSTKPSQRPCAGGRVKPDHDVVERVTSGRARCLDKPDAAQYLGVSDNTVERLSPPRSGDRVRPPCGRSSRDERPMVPEGQRMAHDGRSRRSGHESVTRASKNQIERPDQSRGARAISRAISRQTAGRARSCAREFRYGVKTGTKRGRPAPECAAELAAQREDDEFD